MASCDGLVGLSEEELIQRLGQPTARRDVGSDTWAVFQSKPMMIRIRLAGADPRRVASWTAPHTTYALKSDEDMLMKRVGVEALVDEVVVTHNRPQCPDSARLILCALTQGG